MTTLAQGLQAAVTIPAGYALVFKNGSEQEVTFHPDSPRYIGQAGGTYGPFRAARTVGLMVLTGTASYMISDLKEYPAPVYDDSGKLVALLNKDGSVSLTINKSDKAKLFGQVMPFGRFTSGAVSANSTWRICQTIPKAFKRVRCYMFNVDGTNAVTGAKAQISLSVSFDGLSKPTLGGVASDSGWNKFLFSGSETVNIAATGSAGVPTIVVSDWLVLPSIPPSDGSDYPIVYADRYIPAGNVAQVGYSTPTTGWSAFLNNLSGTKHKAFFYNQSVDAVANPAAFTNTSGGSLGIPMMLEFEFVDGTTTIMCFGDSTKEGTGNTTNAGPVMMVLASLDAAGKSISASTFAHGGTTAALSYSKAVAVLALTIPEIVYFQPFSVNDTSNYAGSASASLTRAQQLVDLANQKKFKLIIETPLPIVASGGSAISSAELAALQQMEVKLLQFSSANVQVLDMRELHDPAKPGVWNVLYGADANHPNPAGYVVQTSKLNTAVINVI